MGPCQDVREGDGPGQEGGDQRMHRRRDRGRQRPRGIDVEQFRVESVIDRVGTTGTVWLGLTIACTVGAFVGLGIWADAALGTSPWFLLVGILLGCVAATASTIVLVRRYL